MRKPLVLWYSQRQVDTRTWTRLRQMRRRAYDTHTTWYWTDLCSSRVHLRCKLNSILNQHTRGKRSFTNVVTSSAENGSPCSCTAHEHSILSVSWTWMYKWPRSALKIDIMAGSKYCIDWRTKWDWWSETVPEEMQQILWSMRKI